MMTMMRWMSVLLSFLQCIWITHCYLYTGTSFRHSIHWMVPRGTVSTITTTTTTNYQTISASIHKDNRYLQHTRRQHSRNTQLCMQSRRSPQPPARLTTPSSSSSAAAAYLLPTPPVNSIGNFFDQSTLVPSSSPSSSSASSSSSEDSDSDSSDGGGGMSFIQCHMIAVGEIEGNEWLYPWTWHLHTVIYTQSVHILIGWMNE